LPKLILEPAEVVLLRELPCLPDLPAYCHYACLSTESVGLSIGRSDACHSLALLLLLLL